MNLNLKRDYNLSNPHLWADRIIGDSIYNLHTRYESEWKGWTDFQIAFLRDVTDLNLDKKIIFGTCNRGGSKTYLTAMGATCLLVNIPNFHINIISGSKLQATTCYGYVTDVLNRTRLNELVVGETTLSKTLLTNHSKCQILPASEKATRSLRADMVIIDEACEAKPDIIASVLPQIITAGRMKLVLLTTPHKLNHIVKEWWDKALQLKIIRYKWNAYDCVWIPRENIEAFKEMFDSATFRIEILADWVSKKGAVFKYDDIQNTLINYSELPPVSEIDRFFLGIDWGDIHYTVASVWGLKGSISNNTDRWYLYAVKSWREEKQEVLIDGIMSLAEFYNPLVLSEKSPISAYSNRELTDRLVDTGIIFRKETPTHKKHRIVSNFNSRLEKSKVKIPRRFKKTIEQLTNYSYDDKGNYIKENDDFVDSTVWAHWGIHPAKSTVSMIGEWEY